MSKYIESQTSLIAQLVKNLPAVQETWVRFLSWEGPLEKGKGNPLQCSGEILGNPWPKVPGGLQSMASPELDTT